MPLTAGTETAAPLVLGELGGNHKRFFWIGSLRRFERCSSCDDRGRRAMAKSPVNSPAHGVGWTLQVKGYTVSKMSAELPPLPDGRSNRAASAACHVRGAGRVPL